MEIKKPLDAPLNPPVGAHKRTPLLFIFAVFLLILTVAGTFYLSFSKTAITNQQAQLDDDIKNLNSQINQLKGQNVEAQQFAKKYLDDLQKSEIHWSDVLTSVKTLLPPDPTTQKPKINFLSYSGSTGGKLTISAETVPAPQAPFSDVSELLNVFNSSSFFKDAYIPSINRGVSDTGNALLSFTFNVTYSEQAADNIAPSSSIKTPDDSAVQNVPPSTSSNNGVKRSPSSQQAGDDTQIKVTR